MGLSVALMVLLRLAILYPIECVEMTVEGLVPAVYTPFNYEGKLNLSVIPQYAKYLKDNRVDGILVAGTSGEGPGLTLAERKQLLDAWLRATKPLGLKVIMQCGGQAFPQVLEMARYSEDAGVDAILTLPELYYKGRSDSAIVQYMKTVSDAAPSLPILYYHHPAMSGVNINCAKFYDEAVSTIPNFKGMKCDFICALEVMATGHVRNDQKLFMTSHLTMAANLLMGINSSMSGAISIYPKLYRSIEEAVANNDVSRARKLQQELNERIAVITSQGNYVTFSKAGMELVTGISVGYTREPLKHIDDEHITAIKEGLRELNAKYAPE